MAIVELGKDERGPGQPAGARPGEVPLVVRAIPVETVENELGDMVTRHPRGDRWRARCRPTAGVRGAARR
ncbi:hypothetical protein [Actinophytocola sp.]|uniref:hypothetical protein n=1 Tax=Actinophytocola sp. TaxID=1872138 RepID=UPI00389A786C